MVRFRDRPSMGSISILWSKELVTMVDYYRYVSWLLITFMPFISLFAYLAVYFDLPYFISPDEGIYRVRLELYTYPELKYWLNLQVAIFVPTLTLFFYVKSFSVRIVSFENSFTWVNFIVLTAAALFVLSMIYFGIDGEEGYLSRGTTTNQFGIQMFSHLSLLGGVILILIPIIYLTWRLGIYHGRSE
jgi:hypothetical protein